MQPRRSFVWLDPFLHKGGFVQAHRRAVFVLLWAELAAGFRLCLHAESGRLGSPQSRKLIISEVTARLLGGYSSL